MTTQEFKKICETKSDEELIKDVKSLTNNWDALNKAYDENSNNLSPHDKYCIIMQILAKRHNDPFYKIKD